MSRRGEELISVLARRQEERLFSKEAKAVGVGEALYRLCRGRTFEGAFLFLLLVKIGR
jgi:hypothetical protein